MDGGWNGISECHISRSYPPYPLFGIERAFVPYPPYPPRVFFGAFRPYPPYPLSRFLGNFAPYPPYPPFLHIHHIHRMCEKRATSSSFKSSETTVVPTWNTVTLGRERFVQQNFLWETCHLSISTISTISTAVELLAISTTPSFSYPPGAFAHIHHIHFEGIFISTPSFSHIHRSAFFISTLSF